MYALLPFSCFSFLPIEASINAVLQCRQSNVFFWLKERQVGIPIVLQEKDLAVRVIGFDFVRKVVRKEVRL